MFGTSILDLSSVRMLLLSLRLFLCFTFLIVCTLETILSVLVYSLAESMEVVAEKSGLSASIMFNVLVY